MRPWQVTLLRPGAKSGSFRIDRQVHGRALDSTDMNVRIMRGAHQVGGSCIEVESAGRRIVLDAGMPMGEVPRMSTLLPDVPGLWATCDGSLLGVFVSHCHPDHVGLVDLIDRGVPVYLGARAAAMCRETRFFVSCALDVG